MTTRIKLRRDTAANWTSNNPVLALGEAGHDTTTNELRIGDGSTTWTGLAAIGGASTSGNILLSANENYQLTLNNNGFLLGGDDGYDDIKIGQDDDNDVQRAYIYISQDNPYIRSEVLSTTSNNYRNEMVWHNPWYSRYSKIYTNAYGAHIQNAQWYGPGNDYFHRWSFTKDGVFNMPPAAVIRSNDYQSSSWYDPIQGEYINDDNGVSSGNDSSLTFDANTISIARGSLNMNGVSRSLNREGGNWIAMTGDMGNLDFSTWKETSCVDGNGNTYTIDGSETPGNTVTGVTKWSPAGERVWQRVFYTDTTPGDGDPMFDVYGAGISCAGDMVIVTVNDYSGMETGTDIVWVAFLNQDDGEQADGSYAFYSDTKDIEVNDATVGGIYSSTGTIAVGRAASGYSYFTPSFMNGITANTVQNGQVLIMDAANTFGYPFLPNVLIPVTPMLDNWYMFGDGITGNVQIGTVNTVGNLTASRVSGGGSNNLATFLVTYTPGGAYTVAVDGSGGGYESNDVMKITGDTMGGATPANDVTFNITADGGYITAISSITGTAANRFALSLVGNPVDFSTIPTPTILAQSSTDALVLTNNFWGPNQAIFTMGNLGWDTFNSVAKDTISSEWGNVYIGGRYHPQLNYDGERRSLLVKMGYDSDPVIHWSVEVDDYTGRNEIRGVAVDSNGYVGTLAVNDNYDSVVTKVSPAGVLEWQRIIKQTTFQPTYDHDTYGIAVDAQNNFIVTGLSVRGDDFDGDNEDLTIISFTPGGDLNYARTLGSLQDEFSLYDRVFRNITVDGDTMIITGKTYAGGYRNTHPGLSVGFVAKLPASGTGIGHYGEWRYLETSVEIETVGNTQANTASIVFTDNDIGATSAPPAFGNIAVMTNGSVPEFAYPSITYQVGGTGAITGLNDLVFTNGATVSNVPEEGLFMWQPDNVAVPDDFNAEYVGMAYGGNNAENANIAITAGTYTWSFEDGDLQQFYYDQPEGGRGQKQVNIDIVAEGGNVDNVSNWHFDENGNMYLPAQTGYFIDGLSLIDPPTDYGNGKTGLAFTLADYPELETLVQAGDLAIDAIDATIMTVVIDTRIADGVFYANVATVFSDNLNVPSVRFSNQQRNGIVFSDGSKQQTAGRKIIPGWSGDRNFTRNHGVSYNQEERLIWTASSAEINAFRGTVRCQFNDTSVAMKIYDVAGASYNDANLYMDGGWDMTANPLVEIGVQVWDPVTFRLDINQGDLIMRIYATAPADATVYMTTDITEFGYTHD